MGIMARLVAHKSPLPLQQWHYMTSGHWHPGMYPAILLIGDQNLYSLRSEQFYHQISRIHEAARYMIRNARSSWQLTGVSAPVMPDAWQFSERYNHVYTQSHGFETLCAILWQGIVLPSEQKPWVPITAVPQERVMMTSSNGSIFRVTGPLCGKFTGHRWISPQRPVMRSFGVFFHLRLNKRLSKQP